MVQSVRDEKDVESRSAACVLDAMHGTCVATTTFTELSSHGCLSVLTKYKPMFYKTPIGSWSFHIGEILCVQRHPM